MTIEPFRLHISGQAFVFVDMTDASDSSERFSSIQDALLTAGATPGTHRSFVFRQQHRPSPEKLQSLVEQYMKVDDQILVITDGDSGTECYGLAFPPQEEGVYVER